MPAVLLAAARAAVLLGLALGSMPSLRRASASTRRLVLQLSLGGALAVPVLAVVTPAWRIEAPAALLPAATPVAERVTAGVEPATGRTVARLVREVSAGRSPAPIAWVLWALGAGLVLVRTAGGLARASRLARRATAADDRWAATIAAAHARTGLRADVRVTDELRSPAVVGMWRPVVLVPPAAASWGDERRLAVLLHELEHVRGADLLGHAVAQLVCAVHWFDPLAWLVARRLRVERELAADEAVVAGGVRASRYAEHLLAIAAGGPVVTTSGVLAMASRSALGQRIEAIVAGRRPRRLSRLGAAIVAGASSTAALAVAAASPAASGPRASGPVSRASSIDPELQRIADDELSQALAHWQAPSGLVLVLDPASGEILASAGRRDGRVDDGVVGAARVPGSTFKAVTLAAALEEGAVSPADTIATAGGARLYGDHVLRDASDSGTLPVATALAVSSNVAFSRIFDRLGGERLGLWARRFHFGSSVDGSAAGQLPGSIETETYAGATTAIGVSMTASPLQLAAAYATFASDGVYVAPTHERRAPGEVPGERLLRPETARHVVAMLDEAVHGERSTGGRARVDGVRVAGKTGTAEWTTPDGVAHTYASFVGLAPAEHTRFVVVAGVESPRDGASGGQVAAPLFARVVTRALAR